MAVGSELCPTMLIAFIGRVIGKFLNTSGCRLANTASCGSFLILFGRKFAQNFFPTTLIAISVVQGLGLRELWWMVRTNRFGVPRCSGEKSVYRSPGVSLVWEGT